jgi:hypothetical protein
MGFLTLIRIYNDGIDSLVEGSKEVCEGITSACARGITTDIHYYDKKRHTVYTVKVFRRVNSNDSSMYLLDGEAFEMNPYSEETRRLMRENPTYFKGAVKTMRERIRKLEKMFKEYKSYTDSQ